MMDQALLGPDSSGLHRRFGAVVAAFSQKWRAVEHRAAVLFTLSSIWLSVAQLLSGIATVHFIVPRDMGLWTSANLAVPYAFFVLTGIQNGLSRELPYYLGANNEGEAKRLASTTLLYTSGGCVLALATGMGTVCWLIWRHSDPKLIYAAAAVIALIIFKFYQNYLFVTFRSKNSFLDLSRVQVWQGVLMIVVLPLLVFGYGGMVVRAVIVGGVGLYLMHRVRPMRIRPAWKTESFLLLIKTGVPIFVMDYILSCAGTLDKLVLLNIGGVEQVGYYALAMSGYSAFAVLPQSIAHYIYPRMSHHYGRTNDPRVLWGIAWKTTFIVLGTMIPIAVAGSLILPGVIHALFPKYDPGVRAAQIALFSAIAYGTTMGANALASLKAWRHLIVFQLSYAGLLAAGPMIGGRLFESPLAGVAYGCLGAHVLGGLLSVGLTFMATHNRQSLAVAAT